MRNLASVFDSIHLTVALVLKHRNRPTRKVEIAKRGESYKAYNAPDTNATILQANENGETKRP